MKIAIACEQSGVVRDAFIRKGHNAISCDILPSKTKGPHYQGYLEDFIGGGDEWDLIIAFPPCTYLTTSAEWAYSDNPMINGKPRNLSPDTLFGERRRDARLKAFYFVMMIAKRKCKKIAIENPQGVLSTLWRKPDQYIHPHQFGHDASKKTGLWLKGLPLLVPTKNIAPRIIKGLPRWENQTDSGQNRLPPSKNRAMLRGETYPGIAYAMAETWG